MGPRADSQISGYAGDDVAGEIAWAEERGEQRARIKTLGDEVKSLREEMAELRKDTAAIREMLATNKGGIRMLLAVGSIAATLGAAIAETVRYLHK